jgi:hypothetical protein
MELQMKNLYECAHFPYLVQKREEKKKSIKPPSPKRVSIWIPVWIPYGAFHLLYFHPYEIFIWIP